MTSEGKSNRTQVIANICEGEINLPKSGKQYMIKSCSLMGSKLTKGSDNGPLKLRYV